MAMTAHGTLAPNVVTRVTIDPGFNGFDVVNRDQDGALWVRFDGPDPTVAGADSFVVLGARHFSNPPTDLIEVALLTDAARAYSVEATA